MNFSNRLENLIEEHNITQKQLSLELHIAPSTLSGYIHGYRKPGFEFLILVARYFHVSTDYLLGLTEERMFSSQSSSSRECRLLYYFRSLSPAKQKSLLDQAACYYRIATSARRTLNKAAHLTDQ